MDGNIALFGSSEKGAFRSIIEIHTIDQLVEALGNPPEDSIAIALAVQTLMFRKKIFFIRVEDEGFSKEDYLFGLNLIKIQSPENLLGICMPGVADEEVLHEAINLCKNYQSLFLTSEKDLYDYLTA